MEAFFSLAERRNRSRVTCILALAIATLFILAGASVVLAAAPICNGFEATIYVENGIIVGGPDDGKPYSGILTGKNNGNDVIVGTDGIDIIGAQNGHNTICSLKGNDNIIGGNSTDWIDAGAGDNTVDTGNGVNTVIAGDGNNHITGGSDGDTITTGTGSDTIQAGNGNNTINAGDGNNIVTSGNQSSTIITGGGNDKVTGGNGKNTIESGAGNDIVITTSNLADRIDGGLGYDFCDAEEGDNTIINCEAVDGNQPNGPIMGILIVKDAQPDSSQSFSFTGDLGSFSLTDNGGVNYTFFNSVAGSYTVTEAATSGWSATTISCTDPDNGTTVNVSTATVTIDLDASETIICTFINSQTGGGDGGGGGGTQGPLTVNKTTIGGDGTFTFTGTGSIGTFEITTVNGTGTKVFTSLTPGNYTITEQIHTNWTSSTSTCTVSMSADTTATCSFTNQNTTSVTGLLIIKKVVVNDNNGTKNPADFSFTINSGTAIAFEADGQNNVNVAPGTYTVLEPSVANYTTTYQNCTSIVLLAGQEHTCTITNNDNPPSSGGGGGSGGGGSSSGSGSSGGSSGGTSGGAGSSGSGSSGGGSSSGGSGGSSSGGGGGGGGGGIVAGAATQSLQVSESVTGNVLDTSAILTWKTNLPAFSRVIYDTVSHPTLGAAPLYGYALSTPEQTGNATYHIIIIGELQPETTYYWRAVSRVSGGAEIVGPEMSFKTKERIFGTGIGGVFPEPQPQQVAGTTTSSPPQETTTPESPAVITPSLEIPEEQPAAVGGATGWAALWDWVQKNWLIILILFIILAITYWYYFYYARRRKDNTLPPTGPTITS